jgi:hypothetical protein
MEFSGVDVGIREAEETAFSAVRTSQYIYVEYPNGDREFYDLAADPYQVANAINNPAYTSTISQLDIRLEQLKNQ